MKTLEPTRLIDGMIVVLTILTFTSLVIPEGRSDPWLAGVPYTMWMGVLISILYVILAFLVSQFKKP